MPDVKWVMPQELSRQCYRGLPMVPVLTLNDIEAWLNNNRRSLSQCASVAHTKWENKVIDDLLDQVQAWVEAKKAP